MINFFTFFISFYIFRVFTPHPSLLILHLDKGPEKTYALPKRQAMTERSVLLKEIDTLPLEYLKEVVDFAGYLRQKKREKDLDEAGAYKEMAADIEREQEAREWCGAYFGPARNQ
jgi:hypothetical protein